MSLLINRYSQPKKAAVTFYKTRLHIVVYCIAFSFLVCCKKKNVTDEMADGNTVVMLPIPVGFPYPDIPPDNPPTKNRIELGEMLFLDPILSRDSTISCSSCHQSTKYFSDNLIVSTGIAGRQGQRNAISLVNVAYQPYLFWDGGNPTLEQQVLAPIDNHLEMDFDANLIVEKLKRHSKYPLLFQKAYHQEPSIYTFTRAIACYERTLIKGSSRYDDYVENKNTSALSASEINGMNIFFGEKGECFHCHQGYNLTDYSFRNNGLYMEYADSGRARITQLSSDIGKFKVPSLRNVAHTAPYMHDGSYATLDDVIVHYVSGGVRHPNKSPVIQPLKLTEQEKNDLLNFLKALSD